jgi:hypothetical protein
VGEATIHIMEAKEMWEAALAALEKVRAELLHARRCKSVAHPRDLL